MGLERRGVLGFLRAVDVASQQLRCAIEILARPIQDLSCSVQHITFLVCGILVRIEGVVDRVFNFRRAVAMAVKLRQIQPITSRPLADCDRGLVLAFGNIELAVLFRHTAFHPMR